MERAQGFNFRHDAFLREYEGYQEPIPIAPNKVVEKQSREEKISESKPTSHPEIEKFESAVALFLNNIAAALPNDIWHVSILEGPAPPPDEGPPLSAHASRNKSLLPIQISGIVGAYVLSVIVSSSLLLFVGRRLRRRAQTSNHTLDMEMVKPVFVQAMGLDPSPVSPVKQWPSPVSTTDTMSWPSPTKNGSNMAWVAPPAGHRTVSSQSGSVVTVDENIIQSDRARGQREMEKLYAAVMEQDARQSKAVYEAKEDEKDSPSKQAPPEFQHLGQSTPQQQGQAGMTFQQEPVSRPLTSSRASSRLTKASPLSFLTPTHSRVSSAASTKSRPNRISIRGLPISPPMGSPDLAASVAYTEEQPLSPRHYTPGPPPPTPGQRAAAATSASATASNSSSVKSPRKMAPAPLPLRTPTASSNSLPFRSAYSSPQQSAPATKTTFLERRESKLGPGPRTGVPYSPYVPFSPVTPVTPGRLVGRQERRKKEKGNGLRVLMEDDLVKSDEDMWGDGFK